MAPLPPIQNVLRIRLTGVMATNNWASIQYARFQGAPPTAADLGTVAASLRTAWQNAIAQLCFTDRSLRVIEVIDLSSDTSASAVNTGNTLGTRAGSPLPNNVAMVASYKIARRYRGGHPRTYWPAGVIADVTSGNLWTQTFLTLANTGAPAWVGNVNAIVLGGSPLQHGVVSYFERDPANPGHSKPRTSPLFFSTQSVVVHTRVDTMRRRLGKEVA